MTTKQTKKQPEKKPGTALEHVAEKPIKDMTLEELRDFSRSVMERSEIIRTCVAQIAEKEWGKKLSPHFQHAIVRYALRAGLDPARHIYVLGGSIYVNAEAYMDIMAKHPEFKGMRIEAVMDNEGLPEADRTERRVARASLGIPDEAKGAFIVKIWKKGIDEPFVGWNWAGGGTRKHDPVGEEHPVLTAQTRAIRRAARQAFAVWGENVMAIFEDAETELKAEREAAKAEPTEEVGRLAPPQPEDPYAPTAAEEIERAKGHNERLARDQKNLPI